MTFHIKVDDFLLDWQYGSKRVFCASAHDKYAHQILFLYLQVGGRVLHYDVFCLTSCVQWVALWWWHCFEAQIYSGRLPLHSWERRGIACWSYEDEVWRRQKLLITFHLQGLRMILTDCEVCCVKSVGGYHYRARIGNISKWQPQSKWPT